MIINRHHIRFCSMNFAHKCTMNKFGFEYRNYMFVSKKKVNSFYKYFLVDNVT